MRLERFKHEQCKEQDRYYWFARYSTKQSKIFLENRNIEDRYGVISLN